VIESPGFLWTILFFIAAIGPLVFVHELGHYWVARWCGVKADVFSIGFGREIFGWTDKLGTRWKVGWLPLGGYVRFAGDANEASMPDDSWQTLPDEERAHSFPAQPVWKRAAIVAAGPVVNFLFAILIYMALFASFGETRVPALVGDVAPKSAASAAGFEKGDRILSVDGRSISRFTDIGDYVAIRANQMMVFEVERGTDKLSITATPRTEEMTSRFGTKATRGLLGIGSVEPEQVTLGVTELPGAAVGQVFRVVRSMVDGLKQIIMGYVSAKELGGPVMIAKLSGEMAASGWLAFIEFVALISINLGFINLLPVPMLDGGHLMLYAAEAVRRKPVSMVAQEWAFRAGFLLLMGFMLFVTFNDLARLDVIGSLIG
jgi:regulator of sigma E protease